jgi:hypothetical protein
MVAALKAVVAIKTQTPDWFKVFPPLESLSEPEGHELAARLGLVPAAKTVA